MIHIMPRNHLNRFECEYEQFERLPVKKRKVSNSFGFGSIDSSSDSDDTPSNSLSDGDGDFLWVDSLLNEPPKSKSQRTERHSPPSSSSMSVDSSSKQTINAVKASAEAMKPHRAKHKSDLLDKKWNAMFALLLQYDREHGHCKMPLSQKVVNNEGKEVKLGSWLGTQRQLRRKNQLSDDKYLKLQALADVGKLDWGVAKADAIEDSWERHFAQVLSYGQRYGHCNIPLRYEVTIGASDTSTAACCGESSNISDCWGDATTDVVGGSGSEERFSHNNNGDEDGSGSDVDYDALQDISSVDLSPASVCVGAFAGCSSSQLSLISNDSTGVVNSSGGPITTSSSASPPSLLSGAKSGSGETMRLGQWWEKQRRAFRTKGLRADRKERVEELLNRGLLALNGADEEDRRWHQHYDALLRHCEIYHHCNVPYRYEVDVPALVVPPKSDATLATVSQSAYFSQDVTVDSDAKNNNTVRLKLGIWLAAQRHLCKKRKDGHQQEVSKMRPDRLEKLQSLVRRGVLQWGVSFTDKELKWNQMFESLLSLDLFPGQMYNDIPRNTVVQIGEGGIDNSTQVKLYPWLVQQLTLNGSDKLLPHRLEALQALVDVGKLSWDVPSPSVALHDPPLPATPPTPATPQIVADSAKTVSDVTDTAAVPVEQTVDAVPAAAVVAVTKAVSTSASVSMSDLSAAPPVSAPTEPNGDHSSPLTAEGKESAFGTEGADEQQVPKESPPSPFQYPHFNPPSPVLEPKAVPKVSPFKNWVPIVQQRFAAPPAVGSSSSQLQQELSQEPHIYRQQCPPLRSVQKQQQQHQQPSNFSAVFQAQQTAQHSISLPEHLRTQQGYFLQSTQPTASFAHVLQTQPQQMFVFPIHSNQLQQQQQQLQHHPRQSHYSRDTNAGDRNGVHGVHEVFFEPSDFADLVPADDSPTTATADIIDEHTRQQLTPAAVTVEGVATAVGQGQGELGAVNDDRMSDELEDDDDDEDEEEEVEFSDGLIQSLLGYTRYTVDGVGNRDSHGTGGRRDGSGAISEPLEEADRLFSSMIPPPLPVTESTGASTTYCNGAWIDNNNSSSESDSDYEFTGDDGIF